MKAKRVVVVLFLACAAVAWADSAWYPISDDEEYLLGLLSSEDARDRYQALSALESAATERSVPTLVGLVKTADPEEAATAVRILGKIGDDRATDAILKRLEATLDAYIPFPSSPDVTGLPEEEARPLQEEYEQSRHIFFEQSSFITAACMALGRVSPEDALTLLPKIMEDPRFEGRFTYAALGGLGYTGDDRAVPIIVSRLPSVRDPLDVRAVVQALMLIGSQTATGALCDLLTNPLTPNRSGVVVETCYVIHDPRFYYYTENVLEREEIQRLEETLRGIGFNDPDPEYRLLALMAMTTYLANTTGKTEELLDSMEALVGTYPITLKIDNDLLFTNFNRHRDLAIRLLTGALENTDEKDDVIRLFEELEHAFPRYDTPPPPEGLWDLLVGFTGDSEAEVRGACLRALVGVYGPDAATYVLDAFDDPSPGVRWEAADVYASNELAGADWESASTRLSGAGWENAYDFILDAAEYEGNRQVYEVMVKALVSTGDPRAVEVLSGIFEDAAPSDRNTRLAMIQMLYAMDLPAADAAIARLAQTDEERRYVDLREMPPQDVSDPEVLLKDYIQNPASRYRGRAIQRYAELVGPEAMEVILNYLPTEDDPEQRLYAYEGLNISNSPIPLDRLLPLLEKEDSPRILTEAIGLLPDEYNEDTVTFLTGRLEEEFAARVDGSHPMFQPRSDDLFSSNDYDDFHYNNSYADLMRKLATIAPEVAHPILLDIYRRDPVEESRASAYELALTTNPAGIVELIREGLESPDAGVRYRALQLVPEYLPDEAVDIVIAAIDDPGFDVKFAAIRMIVDLLGPDATEIIAPQLESPNYYIRDRVGKYLADWGDPRAFDYYYGLWDGRIVHKLTYDIIGNLAKYDDPRGWEVIREVCEIGGQSNEVYYAWLLRAEHGDAEAREFFLSALDDEDPNHSVRDDIFKGLRCFEDDEVREAVERVAFDEAEDWYRRGCAWEVLAFWKDPQARDHWLEYLNDEENLRREAAITSLSNYDDPAVWELIRDAAENDPDRSVRREAQKQLEKREGE
jgi:HEAT repeat protein